MNEIDFAKLHCDGMLDAFIEKLSLSHVPEAPSRGPKPV